MAATEEETVSWGNRFIRNIISALSGVSYADTVGDPSLVDDNRDGRKDMAEIFNFAAGHDYGAALEIPQYEDNGDGVSSPYPLPNGEEGALGASISLSPQDLPAPVITGSIRINQDAPYTASAAVELDLSASSAVTQMQFSQDGAAFTAPEGYMPTKAWTLPSAEGPQTVYVRFLDAEGRTSAIYRDDIVLDTVAPTVYMPQTPSPTENTQPVWSWQAAEDLTSGVSGTYKFYLGTTSGGGQLVSGQEVSGNSFAYSGNLARGTYYAYVSASDRAGNAAVSAVSTLIIKDLTAPVVSLTSPVDGSLVQKNKIISIQARASDAVGVARVAFLINGSAVCTDAAAPYTCSWKVPAIAGRTYALQAEAYDATGTIGRSAVVTVVSK
jgi:hypothetical protein